MPPVPRFDPEELLRHDAFVRELAHRLVFDGQAADDVVQDTWAAALAARSSPIDSMRGWLATVARRVAGRRARTDRRRTKRERAVADDAPAPSVADLVAREEARSAVVRAVLALPESYRDVVVLRWFEGLPPRDVARRLGVPVETVRTRHRRALEQLRETLDGQHGGDRRAWIASLLPLTAVPAPPAPLTLTPTSGATLLGGTLLMSTKLKLTAAALAATAALACWTLDPGAPTPLAPASAGGTVRAAVADGSLLADAGGSVVAPPTEREAATPSTNAQVAAEATTGTVAIHVLWHDRTPAPGVQVLLAGQDEYRSLLTDAQGVARYDDLQPGGYYANIERGSYRGMDDIEQPRFEITAGAEATVEIVVADALDLTGVVVDGSDRPIAGAEILVDGARLPVVVARTGADGRFAVQDVNRYSSVGARAAGLAPSFQRSVTGSRGATVELRFVLDEPSAAIEGRVLGPDNTPVADAIVRLRDHRPDVRLPDGTVGTAPRYGPTRTDENGRFAFDPVAPCELELLVVTDAFSLWTRRVTVEPHATLQLTAHLVAGVTVRGVVRDDAGQPVAGCDVRVEDEHGYRSTHETSRSGRYEVVGAPAGTLLLTAGEQGANTVTHAVQTIPGQIVPWDPVLPRAVELRGRVVDHEGRPVAGADVMARHYADFSGNWCRSGRTDDQGAFSLSSCEAGVPVFLKVDVADSVIDAVRLSGVVPGAQELLITLPAPTLARVRGLVIDERGEPLPNVDVYVLGHEVRVGLDTNRTDGSFEFGPFPAGEYRLLLLHQQRGWLRTPFRAIADGETWDTGPLRMPRGGSLRATFVGDGVVADRFVEVTYENGDYAWGDDSKDGVAVVGPLAPGSYQMHVEGDDTVCQLVPFTIREGVDTVLDVPLQTGATVGLTFTTAADEPAPIQIEVSIVDAATGARRLHQRFRDRGEGLALRTMLPPGRFRIEASGANKMQKTLACSVEIDVATGPLQRRLELRPRD